MNTLTISVLADQFNYLEGPRWRDGKLWMSDMHGGAVYTLTEDGQREQVVQVPGKPSGLGFLEDGSLLIVSMTDAKLLRFTGGALQVHADLAPFVGGPPNDMVVDRHGRAYVGNVGYDFFSGAEFRTANVVMVTPTGLIQVVAEDLVFPNGTIITPDGKTMVLAESFAHRLTAFDIAHDGTLSGRRTYVELPGSAPDGICLDVEGGIWSSGFISGTFVRIDRNGQITHTIDTGGKRAVACQLGGRDGKTLFCLTFAGTQEQAIPGNMFAAVEVTRVEIPGAGSP